MYLFNRVAAHWISEIFLSILKPTVESRRFLGKQQKQVLHLRQTDETISAGILKNLEGCSNSPSCIDPVHVEDVLCESWSLPTAVPT